MKQEDEAVKLLGQLIVIGFLIWLFGKILGWFLEALNWFLEVLIWLFEISVQLLEAVVRLFETSVQLFEIYDTHILFIVIGIVFIFIIRKLNGYAKQFEAAAAARKAEQNGYQEQMIVLGDNSLTLFESLPEHLKSAEEHLNQAEIDFSDGAFAPFWDSIENATRTLGHFAEGVQGIKNNSSQYTDLINMYKKVPPQFPLESKSVEKLTVGTSTAERMKAIVHIAQCNFQFATIYEQRKTNQILVAGFTNLAQALDQMTWQITNSIDELANSVNRSMNEVNLRLGDMTKLNAWYHSEVMQAKSEQAAREKKALKRLDNIQHYTNPFFR